MSAQSPDSVVLWQTAVALCTLTRHPADPEFEIHVYVDGVLLDRECFVDDQRAADYSIEMMHAVGAPVPESS
jgi:hypothetical protein